MHTESFRAQPGSLYVVATPIGNLRDITLRALDVLGTVDLVAAEDTRHTQHLLSAHGITVRLMAAHEHNEVTAARKLVEHLRGGGSAALVTDAGTPAVSDPGARVVRAIREAGIPVIPIPGASAVVAALSVSGIPETGFEFVGFLPSRREARRSAIERFADVAHPVVLYEAPHRIRETLADLREGLGEERRVILCRELTKRFEEIHECALGDIEPWFESDPNRERGEFALVVHAAVSEPEALSEREAGRILGVLLRELSPSRAAKAAAEITGLRKDLLYAAALRRAAPGTIDDSEDEPH